MAFFNWSRWLRSLYTPRTKQPIRKARAGRPFRTLEIEQLESRLSPATFTWTGNGATANWSNAANWSDPTNTAPTGSGNEDLVFAAAAVQFSPVNDIAFKPGTSSPPVFNSITFSGGSYTLSGLQIVVGGLTQLGQTGQVNLTGVTNDTIQMPRILGGSGSGRQTFSIGAASTLTITGTISNASGVGAGWTKVGTGLMTLSGNNTFTEGFTVTQGAVAITNGGALGLNSTTTVQQNAQLQLKSPGAVDDTLVLQGTGNDAFGALVNLTGNNTWVGAVKLAGDTTFGQIANTTLTISGQISDLGSGFNLTKIGDGQLTFSHAGGNTRSEEHTSELQSRF